MQTTRHKRRISYKIEANFQTTDLIIWPNIVLPLQYPCLYYYIATRTEIVKRLLLISFLCTKLSSIYSFWIIIIKWTLLHITCPSIAIKIFIRTLNHLLHTYFKYYWVWNTFACLRKTIDFTFYNNHI